MAEKISFSAQISGRVRLATESDVPHLHKLMYQMAKYHNYTKVFNATEASISTNLFNSNNPCPPFYSVTTFILEVSPNTFPQENTKSSIFDPILKTINLDSPILDLESELFRTNNNNISSAMSQVRSGEDSVYAVLSPSYKDRKTVFDEPSTQELFRTNNNNIFSIMSQVRSEEGDVYEASPLSWKDRKTVSDNYNIVVAGYVLFYPSYSGYFDKPGFFIENMYVRECYRKCGFGKMLFSAVASQAVKMGFTKVDWLTVGWNENAIDFYLGMGAYIMQDVKRFRLSGEGLDAFATTNEDADKS
ncbi:Diamine acetyltransferase 1 [Datura stramonium]|uniref:Diamine acetyltransferase 1 n=1 Tax=Datura stramonium TaxID=4076 RepID=A0ABS8SLT1_DATST|nr:Diamine acetyltransferase 1 [Datura stramonium]